jgi:hypothetical protein
MQVTILTRPVELKVNTISLSNNGTNDVKLYRCFACGGAVVQYTGNVVKIRPVYEPCFDNLVIHKCSGCKELYLFQSHDGYRNKITDVVMSVDPYNNIPWHCYICRQPVALYSHDDYLKDFHTASLQQMPVKIKCSNPACPANYLFTDAV